MGYQDAFCHVTWSESFPVECKSHLNRSMFFHLLSFSLNWLWTLGLYPGTECTAEASKAGVSRDYRQGLQLNALCSWQNPGQSILAFAYAAQAGSRASQFSSQHRQLLIFSSTAAPVGIQKQYCSSCRHLPLSLFCALQHIWGSKSTCRRVEEIPIKWCRSLSIFYNYLCCCYRA